VDGRAKPGHDDPASKVQAMARDVSLVDVLGENEFAARHIGVSAADLPHMLAAIGAASLEALIAETVPHDIRQHDPLDLGVPLSEREALQKLRAIARKNKVLISMIGQGYYGTITPAVIARNILENPAWYTAYTPYQSEISQGRLEALLNFQTMIAPRPRPWPWRGGLRDRRRKLSSSIATATRKRLRCCAPAPSRWAGASSPAMR
jgi:Glycine cleavage system P-protein